ncbi:hypothetical protein FACS189485_19200 [Spirochaetia bacterium]|nr:hypothetical protein FACS189485_19200 [Spirochaetia bacterium]
MPKITAEKFMELFESGSDEIDAYVNKDFATIIHPDGKREAVVRTILQEDVAKNIKIQAKNDGVSPSAFISNFLSKNLPKASTF